MSETRPVVLLGGAIAILAVFLSRFHPAWLLLTETAQPALVAVAVVLAMLAVWSRVARGAGFQPAPRNGRGRKPALPRSCSTPSSSDSRPSGP